MDPFLGRAPWGVGFPQVASTGDTRLLEFGELDDFGCLIGKWKSDFIWGWRIWVFGWKGGFLDLGNWFVDWGREALEKKLGNFDLRKGFAKHTVGTKLEGRRLELVGEED
jgi:hypothetical protein